MNSLAHKPVRVLLTDDSTPVRDRLRSLLNEQGSIQIVGEAASGEEALSLFAQHRPDALVLDIQLPDMSGIEVLRHIKRCAPHCTVVVLTNFAEAIYRQECHRHGADCFLHKNTEFDKVPEVLANLAHAMPRAGAQTEASWASWQPVSAEPGCPPVREHQPSREI
jgi:two-component system, NarL family, response regulator DesR